VKMIDYQSIDAVNWSTLKYMRESACKYKFRLSTPIEDSLPLMLGRATHSLVFEPELFDEQYAIFEGTRRGKEWEQFKLVNAGKTILKDTEIDICCALADAVRTHPLVQPYLADGMFEVPVTWTDDETGLPCKGKPDWLIPNRQILIDLKTARSIHGLRFGHEAAKYGYHCALAHYGSGIKASMGWTPKRTLIVAVEKEPPHEVGIFELDEETLQAGRMEVRELLIMLKACRTSNVWPGRYETEQALQLPSWVFQDDDDDDVESFGLTIGD